MEAWNLDSFHFNVSRGLTSHSAKFAFLQVMSRFIDFLRQDLGVSGEQIELALRHVSNTPDQLPVALWQYGLISLGQLDKIFDWLETAVSIGR